MPGQSIPTEQIVARLEAIQQEVDQLLEQLRPLSDRIHHAEDRAIGSIMGEQYGEPTLHPPLDQPFSPV